MFKKFFASDRGRFAATALTLLALATFIVACGGGGGSTTPVVVTPKAVDGTITVTVTPSDGSKGVPRDTKLSITYVSQTYASSTATLACDGVNLSTTLSNPVGNVITITPTPSLPYGSSCIFQGVSTAAGLDGGKQTSVSWKITFTTEVAPKGLSGDVGDASLFTKPATTARTAAAKVVATSATLPTNPDPFGGVAVDDAVAQLFDLVAEKNYPQYFPVHKVTQTYLQYSYRYYPETGLYVGVAVRPSNDNNTIVGGVYVMGGVFGDLPTYVGQLTSFITPYAVLHYADKTITLFTGGRPYMVTKTTVTLVKNNTRFATPNDPNDFEIYKCLIAKPGYQLVNGLIPATCEDTQKYERHNFVIDPTKGEMTEYTEQLPVALAWTLDHVTKKLTAAEGWSGYNDDVAKTKEGDFLRDPSHIILSFKDVVGKMTVVHASNFLIEGNFDTLYTYSN